MVRTRAENTARKTVAAKAPRKNFNAGSSSSTSPTSAKANKHAGGNPYCPRPTPEWQAEITKFFIKTPKEPKLDKENQDPEDAGAGSSKMEEDDVPTSSKTKDKSKIKKSKKKETKPEETAPEETEPEEKEPEEKMEKEEETEEKVEEEEEEDIEEKSKEDAEMMEVEIEIVEKKKTPEKEKKKKESPKSFKKNNFVSDSEDDD
ncbi:uncharacterized protein [Apostichopus japonicus]|uniref:uncharacterized protein n=1 Tax=Stichopus japonicus TaxID=307972 RepID=UPI003AB7C27C